MIDRGSPYYVKVASTIFQSCDIQLAEVHRALQALDTAGYCIVPKEATDAMVEAGADIFEVGVGPRAAWQAMVAKAQEGQ